MQHGSKVRYSSAVAGKCWQPSELGPHYNMNAALSLHSRNSGGKSRVILD